MEPLHSAVSLGRNNFLWREQKLHDIIKYLHLIRLAFWFESAAIIETFSMQVLQTVSNSTVITLLLNCWDQTEYWSRVFLYIILEIFNLMYVVYSKYLVLILKISNILVLQSLCWRIDIFNHCLCESWFNWCRAIL